MAPGEPSRAHHTSRSNCKSILKSTHATARRGPTEFEGHPAVPTEAGHAALTSATTSSPASALHGQDFGAAGSLSDSLPESPSSRGRKRNRHIQFDEQNLQINEVERLRAERRRIDEPKTPFHAPHEEPGSGSASLAGSDDWEALGIGRGQVTGAALTAAAVATNKAHGGPHSRSSSPESTASSNTAASGRRLSHEEFAQKRRMLYGEEFRMAQMLKHRLTDPDADRGDEEEHEEEEEEDSAAAVENLSTHAQDGRSMMDGNDMTTARTLDSLPAMNTSNHREPQLPRQ
eukprot:ctg_2124.g543